MVKLMVTGEQQQLFLFLFLFRFFTAFFCRFYESCGLSVLSVVCGIRKVTSPKCVRQAGTPHTHFGSRHQVVVHLVSCVVSSFPAFGERVNFTTKGRVSARARRCCEAGQKAQLARHSGTQADRNESQH